MVQMASVYRVCLYPSLPAVEQRQGFSRSLDFGSLGLQAAEILVWHSSQSLIVMMSPLLLLLSWLGHPPPNPTSAKTRRYAPQRNPVRCSASSCHFLNCLVNLRRSLPFALKLTLMAAGVQ